MSIGSNINRIQQAKESIQKTLLKSGANVQGVIDNYEQPILDTPNRVFDLMIKTVNKSDAKNVDLTMISPKNKTSLNNLFYKNTNLTHINASNWDTSKITSLVFTFASMPNLESVDFADWDVRNVTSFFGMFDESGKLNTIDVSKWDTSSAKDMGWMFSKTNVTHLDVSNFDTSNVTSMYAMFIGNTSLIQLDISNFDTSNVLTLKSAFAYWLGVNKALNISGLNLTKCTSMGGTFTSSDFGIIRSDGLRLPNIDMSNIGLNGATSLTIESIVGLLNALPQSDKGYSFQIGSDNIAKLNDEQKAIATNKGWTLI